MIIHVSSQKSEPCWLHWLYPASGSMNGTLSCPVLSCQILVFLAALGPGGAFSSTGEGEQLPSCGVYDFFFNLKMPINMLVINKSSGSL